MSAHWKAPSCRQLSSQASADVISGPFSQPLIGPLSRRPASFLSDVQSPKWRYWSKWSDLSLSLTHIHLPAPLLIHAAGTTSPLLIGWLKTSLCLCGCLEWIPNRRYLCVRLQRLLLITKSMQFISLVTAIMSVCVCMSVSMCVLMHWFAPLSSFSNP